MHQLSRRIREANPGVPLVLRERFSAEEMTDVAPHLHLAMLAELATRAGDFDVIHSHLDVLALPFTRLIDTGGRLLDAETQYAPVLDQQGCAAGILSMEVIAHALHVPADQVPSSTELVADTE